MQGNKYTNVFADHNYTLDRAISISKTPATPVKNVLLYHWCVHNTCRCVSWFASFKSAGGVSNEADLDGFCMSTKMNGAVPVEPYTCALYA